MTPLAVRGALALLLFAAGTGAARPAAQPLPATVRQQDPSGDAARASDAERETREARDARAAAVVARVATWREWLELDLAHLVTKAGPPALDAEPALARSGEAVALVARALHQAGREDEAAALLDRAEVADATWIELERARQLLVRDELRAVVDLLKARPDQAHGAPVRFPDEPLAWLYVGRALNRAGRADDARPFLMRFTELAPRAPEAPSAWHMLATEAFARRDVEAARTYQERGRELALWHTYYKTRRIQKRESPADPLPRIGLAQLWLQAGDNQRAAAELEQAVEVAPDSADVWALLGETRRKLEQPRAAQAAYDRALELDPALPLVRTNRALLLLQAGREAEARADLERVVNDDAEEDPRLAPAYLQLARLERKAGAADRAAQLYLAYLERGGRDPL